MIQNSKHIDKIKLFKREPPVRASEQVASSIRQAIVQGQFEAGDTLPPERSLARRFGVTRNTVREALRRLEQLRLVRIRQGSGVRVLDFLDSSGIEFLVALLASPAGATAELMRDLLEARQILGKAIYAHAIERLDPDELDSFDEAVEAFAAEAAMARPDAHALQELDFEVHKQLVRAGNNRAFVLLFNSLRHVYQQVAHRFIALVDQPHEMAERYLDVSVALHEGNREQARELFEQVVDLGQGGSPTRS